MKIDLDQIRSLLSVVSQTDITELTIESGDEKITVKKGNAIVTVSSAAHVPSEMALTAAHTQQSSKPQTATLPQATAPDKTDNNGAAQTTQEQEQAGLLTITSPMVGTFYRASSPTASPFVEVGTRIAVGQTVCIIEAMKLMNDLPAEIAGKVVKILAENGTTVEFGQPLFLIDPKG